MDAPIVPQKRCADCKNLLSATSEYFGKDKGRKDGFNPYCRTCKQRQSAQWKLNNPDKNRQSDKKYRETHAEQRAEYNRQWAAAHPEKIAPRRKYYYHKDIEKSRQQGRKDVSIRRARKLNSIGSHTTTDIERIYTELNGCCAYCDMPLPADKYHLDHIIPLSRGGSDNVDNLTISCSRCNLSKSDKLLSEWEPPFPDELSLFSLRL